MFSYLTVLEYLPNICDIFMLPSRLLLCCRIGDNIRAGTRRDHVPGTLQRMEVKFTPQSYKYAPHTIVSSPPRFSLLSLTIRHTQSFAFPEHRNDE